MSTQPSPDAIARPHPRPLRERLRLPLMIGIVTLALAGALAAYLLTGRYLSTDDAYVQAARATIASNVAGQVATIAVHDNQHVHRGEVLFTLDRAPFRIAVEGARAKLDTTRLQVTARQAAYRRAVAAVKSAQDTLDYQRQVLDRQRKLFASGIAPQAQFDEARNQYDTARQTLVSAQQQAASVLAALGGDVKGDPKQHPAVKQAQAALDRALLNLSYTTITAPADGIVTQVEQLQVGDHITAAAPVFALISTDDVWVRANFKEDQLTYMHAGQPATITIDAYPNHTLQGVVDSIAPGTGAEFSALPPENATGNWVKVTQRVPVRIAIKETDPQRPLAAGLSARVEVDTGRRRRLWSDDTTR